VPRAVETLLAKGVSQREISRRTGVDRKTIRRCGSNSPMATGSEPGEDQNPPPRPPACKPASSACEVHRTWIEEQVQLGHNAQAIYQDLVERFGFGHRYNSVKRFVRTSNNARPRGTP
jgi:transposase